MNEKKTGIFDEMEARVVRDALHRRLMHMDDHAHGREWGHNGAITMQENALANRQRPCLKQVGRKVHLRWKLISAVENGSRAQKAVTSCQ